MRNAGLEEAQAGIKTVRRNINNLRYADDTTLMTESEEEFKILLMKLKEESENVGLKLSIQKTKITSSGPINSREIEKQWKQCHTSFFWAPKSLQMVIVAIKLKDACSLGKKKKKKEVMTKLDSTLRSRDITLPTKVCLVKAMVFPVVMYGCESWTVKKAESQELMLLNCGVGEDS